MEEEEEEEKGDLLLLVFYSKRNLTISYKTILGKKIMPAKQKKKERSEKKAATVAGAI